ncbi:uncharacterized protein LOC132314912 [Cornus florida]|uniref:uncharacterized protein LOC132314912 n=1 Tax=Cornus florida TaxID=4283 RepID=UPI0028A1E854|nr:uncharacterized protein LOC132314912 [Cornus florida]
MEVQCSPLSWACYCQEEGIEELRHSLLYTSLELETTIVSAHEEIARKEDELIHLKALLTKASRERDAAQSKCQRLMLENLLLQQQQQQQQQRKAAPFSGTTSSEDEPRGDYNVGFSSSDCNKNNVALPVLNPMHEAPAVAEFDQKGQIYAALPPSYPIHEAPAITEFEKSQIYAAIPPSQVFLEKLVPKRPLPEKGKFLKAVMEAGPLLQTLLLAGPLPQWHHPPPQVDSIDIPPVTVNSPVARLQHQDSCASTSAGFSKKRGLVHCEDIDSSPNTKYQKVAHQSPLTNT